MDHILKMSNRKPWFTATAAQISKHLVMIGVVTLGITAPAISQNPEIQEKLAAVKQAAAENKQKIRQYQWVETTQLTLKGDAKPPTKNSCVYGPDGKVQKTMIGAPPPPPSGGKMKQKVIANKKAEMKDYMQDVKAVLAMYVPPDPQKMQADLRAGKVSLNPSPGVVNLIFADYAQHGDKMTLTFDTATKKIGALKIDTYMGKEKDVVTLQVQMASLPDGTSYESQTVLNATAKQLVVTTTNSDYKKVGGN